MIKKILSLAAVALILLPQAGQGAALNLADRLRGQVLLAVEAKGEAWYVNPANNLRYYLKDGNAAYGLMRSLGLGLSESDYAQLSAGSASLRAAVRGKIVLRVGAHGEAYYLCPRTGKLAYLKDGAAAYGVMRECGLGIGNKDLAQIPSADAAPHVDKPSGQQPSGAASLGSCQMFPADNPWNQDISKLPLHKNSAAYVNAIGAGKKLHPDFGANPDYGIPYNLVDGAVSKVKVAFDYADESDAGPYPIPLRPEIEAGSDQHLLMLDASECKLYELYNVSYNTVDRGAGWVAGSGAIWDLKSNALRPDGWTSADAAGLPILPGLVRYDEVMAGSINHAIRFTAPKTQRAYLHPATHFASASTDPALPPMGLRLRLKADYDLSQLPPQAKIIATAMKKYGLILADNGSSWFFQGAYSPGWNDDDLNTLKNIPGAAFEAVATGALIK